MPEFQGCTHWVPTQPDLARPRSPIMQDYDLDDRLVERTRRLVDLARRQRAQLETDLEQTTGMIRRSRELLRKLRMWPKTNERDR